MDEIFERNSCKKNLLSEFNNLYHQKKFLINKMSGKKEGVKEDKTNVNELTNIYSQRIMKYHKDKFSTQMNTKNGVTNRDL